MTLLYDVGYRILLLYVVSTRVRKNPNTGNVSKQPGKSKLQC